MLSSAINAFGITVVQRCNITAVSVLVVCGGAGDVGVAGHSRD
jgi:hypothetical protein